MEGMTDRVGQSFFAGSIRWMAPELIPTLTGDNSSNAVVTTYSDVFAFAAVCLEVATGQLPYHYHPNDVTVLVAVVRGARPRRGVLKDTFIKEEDTFWALLEDCWSEVPKDRPCMQEMLRFFQSVSLKAY
jgi:serine/threonine protein kinase